jgi:hypothetical protein
MKRIASLLLVAVMMLTTVTSIFPPISVSAKTETTYVKRYTVLVLDTSGTVTFTSGGEKIYDADPALTNVKKASKHFLDNISSAEGDNYIAVVSYQDSARVVSEFSKDVSQITKKIDALSASGKSNISAGLEAANELLDRINDEDAIKNVVLCTTGLTWSGNSSYDGKYNDSIRLCKGTLYTRLITINSSSTPESAVKIAVYNMGNRDKNATATGASSFKISHKISNTAKTGKERIAVTIGEKTRANAGTT